MRTGLLKNEEIYNIFDTDKKFLNRQAPGSSIQYIWAGRNCTLDQHLFQAAGGKKDKQEYRTGSLWERVGNMKQHE